MTKLISLYERVKESTIKARGSSDVGNINEMVVIEAPDIVQKQILFEFFTYIIIKINTNVFPGRN